MADKKTIERDGVTYWLDSVKTASKNVGFAPTKVRVDLDALLADLLPEAICNLANRQLRTDAKNLVRPKFSKDKVTPKVIENAINAGTMTEEMLRAAMKDFTDGKYEHNWTNCCAAQLNLGKGALENVNEETIHWDCVK